MKIKCCSDLHLEWSSFKINNDQNADVLILAGDILLSQVLHDHPEDSIPSDLDFIDLGSRQQLSVIFREFLNDCSRLFKNVVYVAGNHCFYHGLFHSGIDYLKEECSKYGNIHFLENDSIIIDDITFLGCSLWTDLNNDPLVEYNVKAWMSDYKVIKNDKAGYRKLLPRDTMVRHQKSLDYLKTQVKESSADKIVVVTHHAPSHLSIDEKYKYDTEMNYAYVNKLDDFIMDNPKIKLWCHGHLHAYKDYMIGETRIFCNPRGYHSSRSIEDTKWDESKIIEI